MYAFFFVLKEYACCSLLRQKADTEMLVSFFKRLHVFIVIFFLSTVLFFRDKNIYRCAPVYHLIFSTLIVNVSRLLAQLDYMLSSHCY